MSKILTVFLSLIILGGLYYFFFEFGGGYECKDVKRGWAKVYCGVPSEKECVNMGGGVSKDRRWGITYVSCSVE
jgi:hypothetical protein